MNSVSDFLSNLPVQDLAAEESVLGAILIDNTVLVDVLDVVEVCDFHAERNRDVLTAMVRLWGDSHPNRCGNARERA